MKYQAPSLAGPYLPPAMASFEKGHYQYNGLRGVEESSTWRKKALYAGALGGGLFLLWKLSKNTKK